MIEGSAFAFRRLNCLRRRTSSLAKDGRPAASVGSDELNGAGYMRPTEELSLLFDGAFRAPIVLPTACRLMLDEIPTGAPVGPPGWRLATYGFAVGISVIGKSIITGANTATNASVFPAY